MQLFYNKDLTTNNSQFTFDKTESRHIVRVLRKKEGDTLQITNGLGYVFNAQVILANDKSCTVKILNNSLITKPWKYNLHVAIAPTKNNDRFEWFLEKATEIGIDQITPIICERSERKVIKLDRLKKIIESAAKQSIKYHFPVLNEPQSFKTFTSSDTNSGQQFIAHCEDDQKESLQSLISGTTNITIMIGPEGDFSHQEIQLAIKNGFKPVSLGESRLRTETAGVVATHIVSLMA